MSRKVLLTAEHHNFGLMHQSDWRQTKYTLFESGTLQSVVFRGSSITASERQITVEELTFIKDNIREIVRNTPETQAYDGEAWQFEGPDYYFQSGYIHDTELELIANILQNQNKNAK